MKCLIYFSLILIFLLGCKNNTKTENKEVKDNIVAQNMNSNSFDSNVILQPLLAYLLDFIDKVDSIPNPYYKTIVYSISFLKENSDTIIDIAASISVPLVKPEFENDYEIKGIYFLQQKPVVIYDYTESIGEKFYNDHKLIKEAIDNYIHMDTNDMTNAWTFVPPNLLCKVVNNDKVIILEDKSGNGKYNFYN